MKLIIKFQILDTFVLTEDPSPRLAIGKGFLRRARRSTSVLNNLQLEYSWPLLSCDEESFTGLSTDQRAR
jgi:hypothetical protein